MATNISQTITTSSTALNISGSIKAIQITNMGTNPVTVRLSETGSAVFGAGIVLPYQYSTFSYESGELSLGASSAIASGGSSDIAIFYVGA